MKKQIKEEDEMPTALEISEMIFEAKQESRKQALEEVESKFLEGKDYGISAGTFVLLKSDWEKIKEMKE